MKMTGSFRGALFRFPRRRRGALLLEAVLSLGIFVMMGVAILSLMERTMTSVTRSRDAARAVDLARSTMAMLEAGLGTARTLNGPVRSWAEAGEREDEFAFGMGEPVQPHQAPWEVRIQTEPSQFEGLTRVSVHAFRRTSRNSDQLAASYTLRQLVRMSATAEDEAGAEDSILDEARRGMQQQGGGGTR